MKEKRHIPHEEVFNKHLSFTFLIEFLNFFLENTQIKKNSSVSLC